MPRFWAGGDSIDREGATAGSHTEKLEEQGDGKFNHPIKTLNTRLQWLALFIYGDAQHLTSNYNCGFL